MIIGIDLGTTNSVAAYLADEGPQLIPNALGEALTPSVVGVDLGGEILVGKAALEFQVLHPERCVAVFKRFMGTSQTYRIAGHNFTPEILSSLVLKSIKADAEAHFQQPIERAVITVPAYFNDNQRKATIHAGRLAGLRVERIINEPTAAAIAYGLHDVGQNKIVAVFDLGGGTFDVSIVELFEGAIEVRATSGECFLGGEDFTRTLAARLLERQGLVFERAEMDAPLLVSRLLQQCEKAKRQLSRQEMVEIRLPDARGELTDTLAPIRRADFQEWTEMILNRVELPIRRSLGDAKLTRADIQEVILVGGATRMPAVVQRVGQIFQRPPQQRLNPDEVVALGAAVQAGLVDRNESLEDFVVTDVCPFTLGIEVSKQFGAEVRDGYFLPILNRNTTIPVSRVERVYTVHSNQIEVKVCVYQGESRRTEDSLLLGEFSVAGIPRGRPGQGIDVRFTYDLNGVLEAEATIVATGAKANLVLTQHVRGLSPQQVQAAVEQMAVLKHHPREESINRFLLKRAERVFRELPTHLRQVLSQILDGFEMVLNEQDDAAAIAEWRQTLAEFLDAHDPEAGEGESHDNLA